MATLFVDKIDPQSGTSLEIGSSGDTISVPTGASLTVPSGGLSGQNYPAFEAYQSATQTGVSDAVWTKMTMNTETFDTDGCYNNTGSTVTLNGISTPAYSFAPNVAGKYYIHGKIFYGDIASTDAYQYVSIYKNGSEFSRGQRRTVGTTGRDATVSVSEILNLSVGDYIEIYGKTNAGNGSLNGDAPLAVFEGYKLVE